MQDLEKGIFTVTPPGVETLGELVGTPYQKRLTKSIWEIHCQQRRYGVKDLMTRIYGGLVALEDTM